jgi:HlyD family secretion protein
MKSIHWRVGLSAFALAALAFLFWSWSNQAVVVDVSTIGRGALKVVIEEDGKTRIKERYIVSSPLLGTLLRIGLDPGDKVYGSKTEVAMLQPTSPQLLDDREIAQAKARQQAAELSVQQAQAGLLSAREALSLAEKNRGRVLALREKNSISQQDVDIAETEYRVQLAAVTVAELAGRIAQFEFEQAKAALLHHSADGTAPQNTSFTITSPIDGEVLRIFQESRAVVQPGTPLLEIGDPTHIEIEVDVLSSDAVKISAGNEVIIQQWGSDQDLHGVVRRVEPAAFTKVSSLGVEEQRVNVLIDILEPPAERSALGDGYQVETKIVYWKSSDCLLLPIGALVRDDNDWSVFKVEGGRAVLSKIKIGQRNREFAEIIEGIEEGDQVISYPSDQVVSGVTVAARK